MNYSEDLELLKNAPEVIVVKRVFDKESKGHIWKLKRLQNDGVVVEEIVDEKNNNKRG